MKWLDSISDSMDMNLSKLQETVKDGEAQSAAVHGVAESNTTQGLENNSNNVYTMSNYTNVKSRAIKVVVY